MRRREWPDLCGSWNRAAAPAPWGPLPFAKQRAPCDWQPGPGRARLQMEACPGGQNSAPCVKLSPLFQKNNRKCEASEKNETSQNAARASHPAARPQRHGGLPQSEPELAAPTGWPLPPPALSYSHRRPLVPAETGRLGLCGSCLARWSTRHSHHPGTSGTGGPRSHCIPSQVFGPRLTCWTFPACIRLWPRARGAA